MFVKEDGSKLAERSACDENYDIQNAEIVPSFNVGLFFLSSLRRYSNRQMRAAIQLFNRTNIQRKV